MEKSNIVSVVDHLLQFEQKPTFEDIQYVGVFCYILGKEILSVKRRGKREGHNYCGNPLYNMLVSISTCIQYVQNKLAVFAFE